MLTRDNPANTKYITQKLSKSKAKLLSNSNINPSEFLSKMNSTPEKAALSQKFVKLQERANPSLESGIPLTEYLMTAALIPEAREHMNKFREEKLIFSRILEEKEREKAMEKCVSCGKTAGELGMKQLLKCAACTVAPCYCSTECQKTCWREHKVECKANRKPKS